MKRWVWILIGIVIIVAVVVISLSYIKHNSMFKNDVEEKENIEETKDLDKLSPEEIVMEIITLENQEENVTKVVGLLPDIDFNNLKNTYGESGVLNLLDWISKQEIEKEEDILILIEIGEKFEGKEYTKYIESIANAYVKDKIKFIKVLSKIPDKTQYIAYALNDLRIYDRGVHNIYDDLNMIINSEELTNEEKRVGIDLINFYAECST
ncbi:MAG: hypothetical protein GX987_09265 [Tissierellia bacterium]|nr:hypothetical protein [Tissierellia bacterium]